MCELPKTVSCSLRSQRAGSICARERNTFQVITSSDIEGARDGGPAALSRAWIAASFRPRSTYTPGLPTVPRDARDHVQHESARRLLRHAVMESFFATVKKEKAERFPSYSDAKRRCSTTSRCSITSGVAIRHSARSVRPGSSGRRRRRAWTLPSLWTPRTRPQGFGKPHRTRFPTAPTPIIVVYEEDRRPKRTTLINLSTDSDQVQRALFAARNHGVKGRWVSLSWRNSFCDIREQCGHIETRGGDQWGTRKERAAGGAGVPAVAVVEEVVQPRGSKWRCARDDTSRRQGWADSAVDRGCGGQSLGAVEARAAEGDAQGGRGRVSQTQQEPPRWWLLLKRGCVWSLCLPLPPPSCAQTDEAEGRREQW